MKGCPGASCDKLSASGLTTSGREDFLVGKVPVVRGGEARRVTTSIEDLVAKSRGSARRVDDLWRGFGCVA